MKKIAQGIVRFRKLILTVAFLLLIPSAIGAVATRINYDILTYLPQDLDSMIGEVALEDDFHLASTGMITVEGLPTNELIAMKKDIEAVPGVMQTFWLSDVIDPDFFFCGDVQWDSNQSLGMSIAATTPFTPSPIL